MTLARRIIPCLHTDGRRVAPGKHFENLRDSGDPAELAARYQEEGADEVLVLDITAGRDARGTFLETIRRVAAQLRIPLTAGGGLGSLEEARAMLRAGADKIAVNTAAVCAPQLINDLSEEFGAQAVVLAVDARRAGAADEPPRWEVLLRGERDATGRDAVQWACEGVERGAGEILLASLDRDGTREGFDCELVAAVSSEITCPLIASGGASTPDDFLAVFTDGRADAALAASVFREATLSIRTLKQYLDSRGIPVRTA